MRLGPVWAGEQGDTSSFRMGDGHPARFGIGHHHPNRRVQSDLAGGLARMSGVKIQAGLCFTPHSNLPCLGERDHVCSRTRQLPFPGGLTHGRIPKHHRLLVVSKKQKGLNMRVFWRALPQRDQEIPCDRFPGCWDQKSGRKRIMLRE